jgi:hypothetical protein
MINRKIEEVVNKALEKAMAGDSRMLKLFVGPFVQRGQHIHVDLPELKTARDAVQACAAVWRAVARGEITIEQGQTLISHLSQFTRIHEVADLSHRLAQVEATLFSDAETRRATRSTFPGSLTPHKN